MIDKVSFLKQGKNVKFFSEMSGSELEPYCQHHQIPKGIVENLANYPDAIYCEDKKWKVIDYVKYDNGSEEVKLMYCDGTETDPKLYKIAGLVTAPDDQVFELEKKEIIAGNTVGVRASNLKKHIDEGIINDSNIDRINVIDSVCLSSEKLSEIVNNVKQSELVDAEIVSYVKNKFGKL